MEARLSGVPARKTVNGKIYWVQNYYDANGKRRQITGKNAADARRKAQEAADASEENRPAPVAVRNELTFERFAETFIQRSRVGRDGALPVDHATILSYESYLRNWINPQLGKLAIRSITRKEIDAFQAHLVASVENRSTARKIATITKTIFNYALSSQVLRVNPAAHMKIAADWGREEDQKEDRIPSREEMNRIEAAALDGYHSRNGTIRKAYQRYYPMFFLMRVTGMRFSECVGLQWGDFDEGFHEVRIRRRVARPGGGRSQADRVGRPKTKNSRRDVPMPADAGTILTAWKAACPPTKEGWLFPTKTGNPMDYHHVRNKFWVPLMGRAGVKDLGMHSLRHFYISLLMRQGRAKEASMFAGHHSVAFTMDQYGHLMPGDEERMDEVRAAVWG